VDAVACPIGINIGAESPEEIAVAVVAFIIAARSGTVAGSATWRNAP
jgi:xanthine/CO dehydrogenase XdhC/CoxF family maturation factor